MAGVPQCEDGFTTIANELLEALCKIRIPGESTQVFWTILRKTYGYKKIVDQISLSQFVAATGMKKPNICRALKQLESLNVIKIDKLVDQNDNTYRIMYRINKHYDTWEIEKRKQSRPAPLSKRIINVGQNDKAPLAKTIKGVIQNDTHKRKKENTTKERADFEKRRVEGFHSLYRDYPRKIGKEAARRYYDASVKTLKDMVQIDLALTEYLKEKKGCEMKFIKHASAWFNQWKTFVPDDWETTYLETKKTWEAEHEDNEREETGTGSDD